ncbi:MAG: lyase family protein, partial [Candidatus Marsarchaeota archaeon]|nr:lyase family protein [Candidatus Marsarchaeota archaeon]
MEAEWVRFFTQVVGSPLTTEEEEALAGASKFTLRDYAAYKKLEEVTRHDVKAIERFLSSRLAEHTRLIPLIHFGLTSEDVNNLAYGRLLKRAVSNVVLPELITLLGRLVDIVEETAEVAMAARTHGQPASPTTLGKELAVHAHRLARRVGKLRRVRLEGKLAGAVGNYGALYAAHPGVDWVEQSKKFVSKMGLTFTGVATQILPADSYTDLFHELYSLNCVLNGLNRDIWLYSSYGYVYEARVAGQVGSSAMPHKSNPIDFENSEGNLEVANALLSLLFSKLATSRMQRDLSDSTV